jgi:hypothetical protein
MNRRSARPDDANIGFVFGTGFPPWANGVPQYIDGCPGGKGGFARRADAPATKYGERFTVPKSTGAAVPVAA